MEESKSESAKETLSEIYKEESFELEDINIDIQIAQRPKMKCP